jgi:polyhydroxyalkanoate synthesis regulator phasin
MVEIEKQRKKILKEWQNKILESYPTQPVTEITGYVEDCTTKIFDKLVEVYNGGEYAGVEEPIDDLMRFLAVDGKLSPGESISILFYIKKLINSSFPDIDKKKWQEITEIVDNFGFIAFNRYSACREDIFRLKLKEKDRDLEIAGKMIEYTARFYERKMAKK